MTTDGRNILVPNRELYNGRLEMLRRNYYTYHRYMRIFQSDLSFKTRTTEKINKSNSMLGVIKKV